MNDKQLESVWPILKELINQEEYKEIQPDNQLLEKKIKAGIKQLENGEGRDFGQFLNEMEIKYKKSNGITPLLTIKV